jgi:hypothetical protein
MVSRVRTVRPGSRTQRGSRTRPGCGDRNGGRGWLALTALRGRVVSRFDARNVPLLPSPMLLIRDFGSAISLQHARVDLTTG